MEDKTEVTMDEGEDWTHIKRLATEILDLCDGSDMATVLFACALVKCRMYNFAYRERDENVTVKEVEQQLDQIEDLTDGWTDKAQDFSSDHYS